MLNSEFTILHEENTHITNEYWWSFLSMKTCHCLLCNFWIKKTHKSFLNCLISSILSTIIGPFYVCVHTRALLWIGELLCGWGGNGPDTDWSTPLQCWCYMFHLKPWCKTHKRLDSKNNPEKNLILKFLNGIQLWISCLTFIKQKGKKMLVKNAHWFVSNSPLLNPLNS